MKSCEYCGTKKEIINVNMPMFTGLFTADLCMNCGFMIHENKEMFAKIIKDRAKVRDIKIPCKVGELNLLMKKAVE